MKNSRRNFLKIAGISAFAFGAGLNMAAEAAAQVGIGSYEANAKGKKA